MRRNGSILLVLSLLFAIGIAFSQAKLDLTGTWEGSTYVEGPGFEMFFIMVLEHKNDTITGKLNDDMGYIDCDITEVKLTDGVLTFEAVANSPEGEISMSFTMECSNSELKGEWDAGGGEVYGEWTAGKKR